MVPNTGTFESTLDDKGRVVIPADFRDFYKGELWIMKGKDKCVWVMMPETYKLFVANFRRVSESEENKWSPEDIEAFERQHLSTAKMVKIDSKTGRIPISPFLRTYANLTKDCLVISIRGYLEIWNAELNSQFMEEMQSINKNIHKKINLFEQRGVQA